MPRQPLLLLIVLLYATTLGANPYAPQGAHPYSAPGQPQHYQQPWGYYPWGGQPYSPWGAPSQQPTQPQQPAPSQQPAPQQYWQPQPQQPAPQQYRQPQPQPQQPAPQQYWQPQPQPQQPAPPQYRQPQPQQPAPQQYRQPQPPPSGGSWPAWPGWSSPSGPSAQPDRRQPLAMPAMELEVELGDTLLYAQQNTVLTLRLVSATNLRTATPELPTTGEVAYVRLDGPTSELRGQKIINRYRYAFTPLLDGSLLLPPIRFTGETTGGQPFEIASEPLQLTVLPAEPDIYPWRPLHGLILQARLEGERRAEAGQPLTLTVTSTAVGATGSQLPSLESQLRKATDFRVYREQVSSEGRISGDGRHLLGSRTERYTLVPNYGGRVRIPGLELEWWNVASGRPESTSVPIRQLVAGGEPGTFLDPTSSERFTSNFPPLLWIPISALFGITFGFWLLAWLRHKTFVRLLEEELHIAARIVQRNIRRFLAWISPIRRMQRMRQMVIRNLPKSYRLWFCVRLVEQESDPEVWSYMLKFLAQKHLGLPPQRSMITLGQEIAAIHPGANAATLHTLMEQLDDYLYGQREKLDFIPWKRAFRRQLRPALLPRRSFGESPAAADPKRGLPQLNPG